MSSWAKEWQAEHPCGTHMCWVGVLENQRLRVRVGLASSKGVRVKFLEGPASGQWQHVHPDDLRELEAPSSSR